MDYALGTTFDVKFNTQDGGTLYTLAGSPTVAAYPDNSTTEITAGLTLTVDIDSRTGLHNIRVVASGGNGFAAGSSYTLVLTAGTVNAKAVTGYVCGKFTIEKESALRPTTAGRTLDVSATGEGGIDWANIGSPTTAQNLSATNIDVDQVVASVSGAVGSVTARVTANVDQVDGAALDTHDAGSFPADVRAIGGITTNVPAMDQYFEQFVSGSIITDINGSLSGSVGSVTGNVGGNVTGSVGSVAAGGITASSIADGAIDRATFAADTGLQSLRSGTLQDGSVSTAQLDASASAVNDFYKYSLIVITGGTGVGQCALIYAYTGSNKTVSVTPSFRTAPTAGSTFAILPTAGQVDVQFWLGTVPVIPYQAGVPMVDIQNVGGKSTGERGLDAVRHATAQSATASTIILDAGASATNDIYKGCHIYITSGDFGPPRLITAYNGTTKVATIAPNWAVTPSADAFMIINPMSGIVDVELAAGTAWNSGAIGPNTLAADTITAAKIAADAGTEIAAAVLAAGDVDGYSLEETLKLCLAAMAGEISGAATTTVVIRAADDSKPRITATVDADGNRTALTLDETG